MLIGKNKEGNLINPIAEVYSTEEQVIGKWVDGKTLYRKVIIMTDNLPPANNWREYNLSNFELENIDYLYFKQVDMERIEGYFESVYSQNTRIQYISKKQRISFFIDIVPVKIILTVEYTKTTD